MTTIACLGASSLSLRNVILIPGSESWREEWNLSMASFGATSSTLLSLSALIFQPTSKDAQQPVNCAHGYRDRKRSRCPACTSRPFSLTHPVSLMADTVLTDTASALRTAGRNQIWQASSEFCPIPCSRACLQPLLIRVVGVGNP